MATENHTTPEVRPSRRALLSTVGFTGLAAVAAVGWVRPDTPAAAAPAQPAVSPDARLIALCTRFDDLEHQLNRSFQEDSKSEATEVFQDKLRERQRPLLQQIIELRATTLEGAQARAKMLHLWSPTMARNGKQGGYWDDMMVWALVRDLAGAA